MLTYFSRMRSLIYLLWLGFFLSGCAKDIPVFTPPQQRAVSPAEQAWPTNKFIVLAYHDIQDYDSDQTFLSVTTNHLEEQFAWLKQNGYNVVSVDQILAARQGLKSLPPKAVLLTFDDGYRSFYTRVLPLLKAYNWPAVLAPVGVWMDTPSNQKVNFGGLLTDRDRFLTWDLVREISRSGLVEIGAHTDHLHYGIVANPQGNTQPAAAVRAYDLKTQQYETDTAYKKRVNLDVKEITDKIRKVTGKKPRVWVWPYGKASGTAIQIVADNGYSMALTLQDGVGNTQALLSVPRMLVDKDPNLPKFAAAVIDLQSKPLMRVVHVDLDYVYDPDPEQMNRNLGQLVQRIADMQVTTVFLQAFADPDGDGLIRSVYFPNRYLPVRADLFNRAAWQLINRAQVEVYAWMPVLSFALDNSIARVTRWNPDTKSTQIDPGQYRRLSPFDKVAREKIIGIYEDLARYSIFDGILYHDDAVLSDFEDASPAALAAYHAAGLPDTIQALRADPATLERWARFKSRYLIDFTNTLTQHVRSIAGPQIKTARNIFAEPILNPQSETWFAQNLNDFLNTYDWTAPMAMPLMENVPSGKADVWLDRLVDAVAKHPGALDKTVFEVQGLDWPPLSQGRQDPKPVPASVMAQWLNRLQLRGARSFGYYPDDFIQNKPRLEIIRPAISNAWYPH